MDAHKRREPSAEGSAARNGVAGTPHSNAALDALQSQSVAVVAIRDDGRRVLYGHFDRIAAEATVAALARVGLRAEVVAGIDPTTRPGTTIRRAQ